MKLKRLRDIFLMFMACVFLGWIYEVTVVLLETHVGYVNCSFLFSPYLPIYGYISYSRICNSNYTIYFRKKK